MFSRRFGDRTDSGSTGLSASNRVALTRMGIKIATHKHQEALDSIAGGRKIDGHRVPVKVLLRREPAKPEDANAVQCLVEGQVVGYVDRADTPSLQDVLRECEEMRLQAEVEGYIVGGSRDSNSDEEGYRIELA